MTGRNSAFATITLLLTITGTVSIRAQAPAGASPAPTPIEELRRLLFWDPILSGNRDIACATCHQPDFAYADGRDLVARNGIVRTRTRA